MGRKRIGACGGGFLLVEALAVDRTRQVVESAGAKDVRFRFAFQGAFGEGCS